LRSWPALFRDLYVNTAQLREVLIAAMTETGAIVETGPLEHGRPLDRRSSIPTACSGLRWPRLPLAASDPCEDIG
jgi:hypothetical protein